MSKGYSGMCIGGQADGTFARAEGPWLKVAAPLPTPPWPVFDEPIPTTATIDVSVYRHVEFHFRHSGRPGWEETRGFWTPEGVEDQHLYVLDQLATAYRANAQGSEDQSPCTEKEKPDADPAQRTD